MKTKRKTHPERFVASGGGIRKKKKRATKLQMLEPQTRTFKFYCGRCNAIKGFRLCFGEDSYVGDGTGPVNSVACDKCNRIHKIPKGLTDLLNAAFQSGKDARSSEIRNLISISSQRMSDA